MAGLARRLTAAATTCFSTEVMDEMPLSASRPIRGTEFFAELRACGDRRVEKSGERIRFSSAILERWSRRTEAWTRYYRYLPAWRLNQRLPGGARGVARPERAVVLLAVILSLAGTLAFAMSGAILGVRRGTSLAGVIVLAFVTAVSGGILRDVLIGALPPEAVSSWHVLVLVVVGGLAVFVGFPPTGVLTRSMLLFDAIGLACFTVLGTGKALDYGLDPIVAAFLGVISGIGGGIARDLLVAELPMAFHSEYYSAAALSAAALTSIGYVLDLPPWACSIVGVLICIFLRIMTLSRHWKVPIANWDNL